MTTVRPRRRIRRSLGRGVSAFTVLELLIVLALVAALGAMVFPPLSRWVDEYRFRETVKQFDAAMDACRAAAQRGGRALVLVARTENGGLRVRSRDAADVATEGLADAPRATAAHSAERREVSSGPETHGLTEMFTAPSLARFSFPPGFGPDAEEAGGSGVPARAPAGESAGLGPEVELAVVLPDGTAAAGTPWRVRDAHGRVAETAVDRWSGTIRLRPVATTATRPGEVKR